MSITRLAVLITIIFWTAFMFAAASASKHVEPCRDGFVRTWNLQTGYYCVPGYKPASNPDKGPRP